jgi:hypothetical protein
MCWTIKQAGVKSQPGPSFSFLFFYSNILKSCARSAEFYDVTILLPLDGGASEINEKLDKIIIDK